MTIRKNRILISIIFVIYHAILMYYLWGAIRDIRPDEQLGIIGFICFIATVCNAMLAIDFIIVTIFIIGSMCVCKYIGWITEDE